MTYAEAATRLGVTVEAIRQRAIRNKWARTLGNDKRARVCLPDEPYPTQTPIVRPTDAALLDALREHIATLKTDIERLTAELAGERAARQADRERHQEQLAAERADRLAAAEESASAKRIVVSALAAQQADRVQHREQLAAERAARQADADKAIAELVELARRLAAITQKQTLEPPQRSAAGRAWRWFLRN
jgi:hypothetical protein